MRKIFFASLVMLCAVVAQAQQKYTLNGYVRGASDGEELIGVTVLVKELSNGVISNAYGFYISDSWK